MSDQRMIDTQARHITRLNDDVKVKNRHIENLQRQIDEMAPAHDYYMLIQKHVLANDACMLAWEAFLVTLALSLDEPVPGLTAQAEPDETIQYSLSFGA